MNRRSIPARLLVSASILAMLAAPPMATAQQAASARTVLPLQPAPYTGTLGHTPAQSSPPQYRQEARAPQGAPNVLLIMTDDVGFGASGTFGGPIPTPTFDDLAAHGLRYNEFHTTALCSPTRAALLTGRNHHSVGSGTIAELATGYPGYTSVIPKSAATITEVLRQNGYSTAQFGKNHNVPDWQNNPAGPFDNWPNGLGFEYFYGFNAGDTNQWAPALVENRNVVEPPVDDPTYILDRDLGDHAISWLRTHQTQAPDKPFLMYYAPGSSHAPHQAPKEWIAKFKGQFDQGWDKLREETFARQKRKGVVPADAELTPRPPEIPAWDSLSADQKKIASRLMEVNAAALAYADYQIGRVIGELRQEGKLDNTIVIYIQGDNGASAEGGLNGTIDDMAGLNGVNDPVPHMLAHLDDMGGPMAEDHYPVGFAWAMDTPFQWTKQIASHWGGTRNGMVISWPARIKAQGQLRSQFSHVIDIAPTLYEAIGVAQPTEVNGVQQKPIEGTSMVYSFDAPKAPERHHVQYFEMFANRAIYEDGWVAATHPKRVPWVATAQGFDADSYSWELYHVASDYSEAHDLAAQDPARLAKLQADFWAEAGKYNVLPIDPRALERTQSFMRPYAFNGRQDFTFYPGPRLPDAAFPDVKNKSFSLTATVDIPPAGAEGVLATQGGRFGGWGLLVYKSVPTFIYKFFNFPGQTVRISGTQALAPGKHLISVEFQYDGGGLAKGGTFILKSDGAELSRGRIEHTVPGWFPPEGVGIGHDTGTPIAEDYKMPFAFTGTLERLDVHLATPAGKPPTDPD
ncbi:MAG TPA: arylsulfatase [Caulobacteraceae bacterium]